MPSSPDAAACASRITVTVAIARRPPRKHRDALADGRSPATGLPLATCGDCANLTERQRRERGPVLKCALAEGRHGGPDVDPGWLACAAFRAATLRATTGQAS